MATLYPSTLDALFLTFDKRYQAGYDTADQFVSQVATIVPSASAEQRYAWMDKLPRLREWLGERVVNNAIAQEYAITNKRYESTVALEVDKIDDDQISVFAGVPEEMGRQAKVWPDQIMATLIEAGGSTTTFDGQFFFDTDHPTDTADAGSAVQSNTFPASPLSATTFQTVRAAMRNLKGRDGNPLGVMPNLLMVPPALEATALQILNAEFIAPALAFGQNAAGGQQSNVLKGSANLLVNPWLTDANDWFLLDVSRAIKPFVWQLRLAPKFTWMNRPEDANVFMRDEILYGVKARGNAGFGLWFLAARGVG
jgi:phage major head subunit gpT-like protein